MEALENINIAMILALAFFVNGSLGNVDYREFIRANSLSHEHLVAAKHFLQRDFIFTEAIETELAKWYSELEDLVMQTLEAGNFFDIIRHNEVFGSNEVNGSLMERGAKYLDFMNDTVLFYIEDFQKKIRNNIR
jgi:hypothetical protein